MENDKSSVGHAAIVAERLLKKLTLENDKPVGDVGHLENPANDVSEHSGFSRQKGAPGEDSWSVTVCIGQREITFSFTGVIHSLNYLLWLYSSDIFDLGEEGSISPVRHQAMHVSLFLIDCSFIFSEQTGKSMFTYLEQAMVYMEKPRELSVAVSTDLQCFFLFRCAKIFNRDGRTKFAMRACDSARAIAAREPHLKPLELVIQMLLITINGRLKEQQHQQLRTEIREFLMIQSEFHIYEVEITGFILEMSPLFDHDLDMIETVIRALNLRLEWETRYEATNQRSRCQYGYILLILTKYFSLSKRRDRRGASLLLLEEAVARLQQAECTCRKRLYQMDELQGLQGCGCHRLLSEAFYLQGVVHVEQGNLVEAEKSFQRALSLAKECDDTEFVGRIHLWLANTLQFGTCMNDGYGIRIGAPGLDSKVAEDMLLHQREWAKCMKDAFWPSYMKDLASIVAPSLENLAAITATVLENDPTKLSDILSNMNLALGDVPHQVANLKKLLALKEQKGDYTKHAEIHTELSSVHARLSDHLGIKEHFSLALDYLRREDVPLTNIFASSIRQRLGQIALLPEVMELDHAYDLWKEEYLFAQEMLEDLAHLSEDRALRYFETSKQASMALAKCQMTRVWILTHSAQTSQYVEAMKLSFEALMWAERGKGRMLMSFIAAIGKKNASKVGVSTLHDRLDLPSDYTFNFESRFLKDDSFAKGFLQGRPPPTSFRLLIEPQKFKTMFIEYTFIDHNHLLTQVINGDRILVMSHISDLSEVIDKEIQIEANSELRSLQNTSSSKFEELGPGAGAADKVLSAMNKYGTNRIPFNTWIPGMVVGIQRRAAEAQLLRRKNKSFHNEEQKIRQLLQALYAILIQPVAVWLGAGFGSPGLCTLVFVPHEDLGVVPFAALHEKDGSRYLIEDFAISVSPAIWCSRHCEYLYEEKIRSERAENMPVLVGRKSGYSPPFSNLSQAHDEVAAAAQALGPKAHTTVLDDTPETSVCMKERVMELLPQASWIHLSVHGEVSAQFPQGSMLFGADDDQRLTATEIITSAASSPWSARCAIASACQTGLGSVAGGGIMGFARSFILAGVPSCVLSLWEVNEAFCTSFTGKLYSELGSGETLGDAIKSTLDSMIKEKKPPPRQKKKSSRFNVETPAHPEQAEPMWSILDWAAFSCFGYPGVKLVTPSVVLPRYEHMLALAPDPDRTRFTSEELREYCQPTLFANGTKGFCLDSVTRGICLRMAARGMNITWGNDNRYWEWCHDPRSWFSEVAILKAVCWFEARGEIDCTLPAGSYTFSWRFSYGENMYDGLQYGWLDDPAHFILSKNDEQDIERKCFMSTSLEVSARQVDQFRLPTIRIVENGWREYDVGEFSIEREDKVCMLKFAMLATSNSWKSGLLIDGVVIRSLPSSIPKEETGVHFMLEDIRNFEFLKSKV